MVKDRVVTRRLVIMMMVNLIANVRNLRWMKTETMVIVNTDLHEEKKRED